MIRTGYEVLTALQHLADDPALAERQRAKDLHPIQSKYVRISLAKKDRGATMEKCRCEYALIALGASTLSFGALPLLPLRPGSRALRLGRCGVDIGVSPSPTGAVASAIPSGSG